MKRSNTLAREVIALLEEILPRTPRLKESVIKQVDAHFKGKVNEAQSYLIEDGLFRTLGLALEPGYEGIGGLNNDY